VLGQSGRAAEINAGRRGLNVGIVTAHLDGLPPDQVVAESPPPDSSLISPNVSLLVTAPAEQQSFVMPDLVGRKIAEVAPMLEQAGFRLGSLEQSSPFTPPAAAQTPGAEAASPPITARTAAPASAKPILPRAFYAPGATITRQSPAAGQRVSPGMTVLVSVTP